ncbi:3-dehydroquinate synthase [Ameyamaea chiangmaiensis]|uniref:Multifunctional fusion protein n=1 Tax=Ameyamaea chiangmaiensis TaxID=442969 RepID=A0A850P647_9PROT|nr:3-dehydroquinate synthase [Ameyamaea chiangmaiensis]NVN39408.1 3-dehydroquinate synthase [Ameyamaea chiangmaiensis]
MSRTILPTLASPPDALAVDAESAQRTATAGRSNIVLVGLMGAGKTTVGRRLAQRLELPFIDADAEIERAAGCTIAELFERHGEAEFRKGEKRVISRLLAGRAAVIATGGGAFMDADTRALIRARARSVWLRCPLSTLHRRVQGKTHRPLLNGSDPIVALEQLIAVRYPIYAEADIIVDSTDDSVDNAATRVIEALANHPQARQVHVGLPHDAYDVTIGEGLIARAGALLAPVLPQKRVIVITDETVASLHLDALMASFERTAIAATALTVPAGESSKRLEIFGQLSDGLLEQGVERRTTVVALGGGVVGDLAGFVAASTLRGLPFVQIPTTLLSQVDSSVGGKTGINSRYGKNLIGAFHQPIAVLADISALRTLPPREVRAGYAEILKAGLISDPALFEWCERNAPAVLTGDPQVLSEAVERACAFKTRVVLDDEREEKGENGRALLNLGHTFAHALEAEMGFDGRLLHGEAVSIGLRLAFDLSVRLGVCPADDLKRISLHLERNGMPDRIAWLNQRLSTEALLDHMKRDKKMRDGQLSFVLARGIGAAFTCRDVPADSVRALFDDEGCVP